MTRQATGEYFPAGHKGLEAGIARREMETKRHGAAEVGIALAMWAGGCAPLPPAPAEPSQLPPARLAADAVVLDIAFVRLPANDADLQRAIWDAADEQSFPTALRSELATNGLRVGVYGQQLPARLRELLDAPANPLAQLSDGASGELELSGAPATAR